MDEALQQFGFAMGSFRMYDVVGIDLEWRARQLAGQGMDAPLVQVDNALCELGRLGQKTGVRYYRYAPGSRQAEHDPLVDECVLKVSQGLGYRRREIDAREILDRCLLALVNEGAKILEEGIAASSHDIDQVWLNGYGLAAGGHSDFMGCFVKGFLEPNSLSHSRLLLRKHAETEGGRVLLYTCPECGDIGCGAYSVYVRQNDDCFTWGSFAYENGYEEPQIIDGVGPFSFEKDVYEAAINDAAAF